MTGPISNQPSQAAVVQQQGNPQGADNQGNNNEQMRLEALRLQRELSDRQRVLGDRIRGTTYNIQRGERELPGRFNPFARIGGARAAMQRSIQADRNLLGRLQSEQRTQNETSRRVDRLMREGKFEEAVAVMQGREQEYRQRMLAAGRQAVRSLQSANEDLRRADVILARTETGLRIARNTAVIVGATVATGGTATAMMAAGYGTVAVAGGAIAVGTAAGTTIGGASNLATAGGQIANGRNAGDALADAGMQTLRDARDSAITSVGTVAGVGVAGRIVTAGGGQAATMTTRVIAGSAAGATNATVTTAANTGIALVEAERDFNRLIQGRNLTAAQTTELRGRFMRERGLAGDQILWNAGISVVTGTVSGGAGARFQGARDAVSRSVAEGTRTQLRGTLTRTLITTGEAATSTTVGLGAAVARDQLVHGGRGLTFENIAQEVIGSSMGSYIGGVATSANRPGRTLRQELTQFPTFSSVGGSVRRLFARQSAPPSRTQATETTPKPAQQQETVIRPPTDVDGMSVASGTNPRARGIRNGSTRRSGNVPQTDQEIAQQVRDQTRPYTAREIDNLISSLHPSQQSTARQLLARLSRNASPEILNTICQHLAGIESKAGQRGSVRLIADGRGGLADLISYLQRKGNHANGLPRLTTLNDLAELNPALLREQGTRTVAFLVDNAFLSTLQSNPQAVRSLQQLRQQGIGLRFIHAEGWNTLNPLNQGGNLNQRLGALSTNVNRLMRRNPQMTQQQAIDQVLNGSVRNSLRRLLGMRDANLEVIRAGNQQDTSSQAIASNMNQRNGLTVDGIMNALGLNGNNAGNPRIATIRRIIASTLEVRSPRAMAELYRAQHQDIVSHANGRGIPQERIYYLIPEERKSYGVATGQYAEANRIPQSRVINRVDQIPPHLRGRSMIVVLDDFAGTGDSFAGRMRDNGTFKPGVYQNIRSAGFTGEVVLAPAITTPRAAELFFGRPASQGNPEIVGLMGRDPRLTFLPGELHTPFRQTEFYRNLPPEQRQLVDATIGQLRGYGNTESSLALWYMAPNNNLTLIERFARLFTLNGNGVKDTRVNPG